MASRSTTAIVFGVVGVVLGGVLIIGGMGPLGEYRDADGYYMSDPFTADGPSYAIVSGDVDLLRGRWETLTEGSAVLAFVAEPADVRMQGVAPVPDELFMGIAATSAVDEYLSGVAHREITDWSSDLAAIVDVEYTTLQGTAPPGPPGNEDFWEASVEGTERLTLDWTVEPGEWTTVIMNADASPGVTAELAFGAAPSANIDAIAWASLAVGLILLIGGGLLLYLGLRRRDQHAVPAAEATEHTAPDTRVTSTRS